MTNQHTTTFHSHKPWLSGPVTVKDLTKHVEASRITEILLGVPDMQGRLKGKIFNAPVFLERMTGGTQMCAYILATDTYMTPLDGFAFTGWSQGFGDFLVKPEMDTARMLPHRPGTALVFGTPLHDDNTPVVVAPRHLLASQVDRLGALGYRVQVGVESEFVLYPQEAAGGAPMWSENLDYALQHPPAIGDFLHDVGETLTDAGIVYEAIKTEGAPGQTEVSFAYGDVPFACDDYTVFRHIVRDIAGRRGMVPVFMAAPETGIGSGLHLHLSLVDDNGRRVFAHQRGENLPALLQQATAGLLSALPHLAPLYAPTVNSYKRYRPRSFAPTRYNWGIDHRGCAIRVAGHGDSTRLEVRLAGADANVYLALAAYLAAMVHGIEEKLPLRAACDGDAYTDRKAMPLYADLSEALQHFEHSTLAHTLLGKEVVHHYARAAHAELDWHRRHVTDHERQRGVR
ncbi:glutamine synthetase family protein [Streptomyces sp. NPDC087903]|uniref:glutamine synthetase family protein n=1 Tax=Streptomyces sp. NPDC087903 TaxID=3365819 RepID=UPI00381E72DC